MSRSYEDVVNDALESEAAFRGVLAANYDSVQQAYKAFKGLREHANGAFDERDELAGKVKTLLKGKNKALKEEVKKQQAARFCMECALTYLREGATYHPWCRPFSRSCGHKQEPHGHEALAQKALLRTSSQPKRRTKAQEIQNQPQNKTVRSRKTPRPSTKPSKPRSEVLFTVARRMALIEEEEAMWKTNPMSRS